MSWRGFLLKRKVLGTESREQFFDSLIDLIECLSSPSGQLSVHLPPQREQVRRRIVTCVPIPMVRFPEPIVQPMREAPQLDEKRIDLVALAVCSARTASQAHEAMVWGPLVPLANIELDFQLPSPSPVEARVRKQGPLGEAVTSSGPPIFALDVVLHDKGLPILVPTVRQYPAYESSPH